MCAVIFKSELPVSKIPLSWKLGIDITINDLEDRAVVMKGGPCCTYNDKEAPCFYGTALKASITSNLLADMLKFIHDCGIFNRNVAKPFLLLDGHGSRMMLPFLKYKNDPEHGWVCCIGVPYATHIWQVRDASGLNGSFKITLAKAKREYLRHRSKPTFEPTDLVPLLNKAWEKSFNNRDNVLADISHRGWNPLNYNLLNFLKTAEKNVIDLTTTTSTRGNDVDLPPPLPLPHPNLSQGIRSYYMDKLLEEEQKSAWQIEKNKQLLKSKMKTREEKVKHLKKLTKISSAVLTSDNHYALDKTV